MIPIYVVLSVCLIASPPTCREIPADSVDADNVVAGMMNCMLHGEEAGAAWIEAHPAWQLKTVHCYTEKPVPGEDL